MSMHVCWNRDIRKRVKEDRREGGMKMQILEEMAEEKIENYKKGGQWRWREEADVRLQK